MGSTQPVTRASIRASVTGYDPEASDSAFERMFERDKDELRSMGIPVETVFDVNGEVEGYVIRQQNATAELDFNADELALLALATAVSQEAILEAPATTALRKIETVSGDAPEVAVHSDIRINATDAALLPLMASLREQRTVTFDYQGRSDVQAQKRVVDPWGVIAHEGAWYFIGFDRDKGARRTFRLSRIHGTIAVTAKTLEHPRPAEVNLIDVVRGEPAEQHSVARVFVQAGFGAALRMAHESQVSPFVDTELEVRAITDDVLVSIICAAGSGVQVIEPAHIRERVIATLQLVAASHGVWS